MSHKHGLLNNMHELQMHLCDADGSVFGRLFPHNPIVRPTDLNEARELLGALAASMKSDQDIKSDVAAGMTFLGQFVDHDITHDPTSLSQRADGCAGSIFLNLGRLFGRRYRKPISEQPFGLYLF